MKTVVMAVFLIQTGIIFAQPADDHTLAYWKINEGAGDFVGDSSSYGNHGTVENALWTTDAKTGGAALEFNGQISQVTVTDSPSLHPTTGNITIGAWIKVLSSPKSWSNAGAIVFKGGAYQWVVNTNGTLWFGVWGSRLDSIDSYDFGQHLDEWHHCAVTYDNAAQRGWIYIDGELNIEGTVGAAIDQTPDVLYLGYKANADGWFHGIIDEVRISDIVRTQDEIKASMMGGAGYPFARGPNPPDGSLIESTWVNLSWKAGDFAVSHDVYIGDNFDDVNNGTLDTFRGNQKAMYLVVGFPGFPYPEGLVPGTNYYWRIDEVNDANAASPWKGEVWGFFIPPKEAYNLTPVDGAKYVDTNVTLSWMPGYKAVLHHVYFGDNFDDVNNATVGIIQADTTYSPEPLELDKVYYWRVDEFDGATIHKGDVLSFRTMPEVPVNDPDLICWWTLDEGFGNVAVDWSGHGRHGTIAGGPQWVEGYDVTSLKLDGVNDNVLCSFAEETWSVYTVTLWARPDRLSQSVNSTMFSNHLPNDAGFQLDVDGTNPGNYRYRGNNGGINTFGPVTRDWVHIAAVCDGIMTNIYYNGSLSVSFVGSDAVFNKFGVGLNRTEDTFFEGIIDDVRVYNKVLTQDDVKLVMRIDPLLAWEPGPANGSTSYIREILPLSWSPGDMASQHDVYFGTDRESVSDADASDTTGVYRGRQSTTGYTPPEGVEWGGGPYYWRIDENNTDVTVTKGRIWSFTVADFLEIEDFEDYNDFEPDRIFDTWTDGWGVPTNGSEVGYAEPNFTLGEHHVETTIVHGGFQSMPYTFDNNFKYSEATLPLVSARNWTEEGVAVLSLWFYGDPSNAAEQMYVSISNGNGVTGTVYHDGPAAAQIDTWTQWTIELKKFADQGVNLTNVDKFYIGFGDKANLQAGGTGKMYFDDICLKRPTESLAGPAL